MTAPKLSTHPSVSVLIASINALLTGFQAPKAKKRKTEQHEEVEDEEGVEEEGDEEVEAADLEEDEVSGEEDEDDEQVSLVSQGSIESLLTDRQADETAKSSGPAASAKARKGGTVPKEADLEEVEDDEE